MLSFGWRVRDGGHLRKAGRLSAANQRHFLGVVFISPAFTSDPGFVHFEDYFEGLAQPQLQKSLHYFLQNTSPDGEWSVLQEGARVLAQNKEGMQKIIQEPEQHEGRVSSRVES